MASTLLNELGYNRDWIERQLVHAPTEQIRGIYNLAEYLPERREAAIVHDERIEYGRRVVWYAFGTAGDIDIANVNPTPEQIKRFIQEMEYREKEKIPRKNIGMRMR